MRGSFFVGTIPTSRRELAGPDSQLEGAMHLRRMSTQVLVRAADHIFERLLIDVSLHLLSRKVEHPLEEEWA